MPWLFLPPALLFAVSVSHVIHPLYVFRYIAFCIPAAALLAGTALAALARKAVGWGVAVAALVVIVAAGLPAQGSQRTPTGHGYDIRLADQAVASRARPGDALLNIRYWPLSWGGGVERGMAGEYPYGLARLHDISLARGPVPSGDAGRHVRADVRGAPAAGHGQQALGRLVVQGSLAASATARVHAGLHIARERRMAAPVHPAARRVSRGAPPAEA